MAVMCLHGIIELSLGIVNHFPLYTLILRIASPSSMPGNIFILRFFSYFLKILCLKTALG